MTDINAVWAELAGHTPEYGDDWKSVRELGELWGFNRSQTEHRLTTLLREGKIEEVKGMRNTPCGRRAVNLYRPRGVGNGEAQEAGR